MRGARLGGRDARSTVLALVGALGALAACRERAADPGQAMTSAISIASTRASTSGTVDLLVRVADGSLHSPDTLAAGWTRVRVEESGSSHIVVAFRLPDGDPVASLDAFLTALDTAIATPSGARAVGGSEVGDTGEVVLEFAPGRYVLACVVRGRDGHRHAIAGESKLLLVPASDGVRRAPPVATTDLPMLDFAFTGPERWRAGSQMVRVVNVGRADHQVRMGRLLDGVTLRDWLQAADDVRTDSTVAGMARLSPGGTAYMPVEVTAGRYVIYCLIPDPASGEPHALKGMFREIIVE